MPVKFIYPKKWKTQPQVRILQLDNYMSQHCEYLPCFCPPPPLSFFNLFSLSKLYHVSKYQNKKTPFRNENTDRNTIATFSLQFLLFSLLYVSFICKRICQWFCLQIYVHKDYTVKHAIQNNHTEHEKHDLCRK